jgi:hypothetical protein
MRQAPELHWRWRGEPGPPVDKDLSSIVVVCATAFSGLLFVAGLMLTGERALLTLFAQGGAITLTAAALVLAQAGMLLHASPRLLHGDVRLWIFAMPPTCLFALGAAFAPLQGMPPLPLLANAHSAGWASTLLETVSPQLVAALLGGALLLPLLLVGVAALAEGARRRRWPLARRGGWLALTGCLGLWSMRWSWVRFVGLRRSDDAGYWLAGDDAAFEAVASARWSTAAATAGAVALVLLLLAIAWRRRTRITSPADTLASAAMFGAPALAAAILLMAGPDLDALDTWARQALLAKRPSHALLEPAAAAAARRRAYASSRRVRWRYGSLPLVAVDPEQDAAAFVDAAYLRGRHEVLLAVEDRPASLVERALALQMVPPLPLPLTLPLPLYGARAGDIADLVLVFNSRGLKAQGEAPTEDVEALITEVEKTRGSSGLIVVVPVAGTAGALVRELQRRTARSDAPRWVLGRGAALLDKPCGCFIGPAPGNDPDTYLDARLCLSGGEVRGELRWLSRNSGSNTRRVAGTVRGAQWTLHDEDIVEARAQRGYRFCKIDRYALTQDSQGLKGTYVSEACDDQAKVDLSPVDCPEDMNAPAGRLSPD